MLVCVWVSAMNSLGRYDEEELKTLQPSIDTAVEIIKSFVLAGIDVTMNQFNKLGRGSMSRNEEGGRRNELEEGGTRKEERGRRKESDGRGED